MISVLIAHLTSEIIREKRADKRGKGEEEIKWAERRHRGLGGFTGDLPTLL